MRFGISTIDITPPFKTPMGGYFARQGLFEKINDPLSCSVVILEAKNRRVVLVAADLIGFNAAHTFVLRKHLADLAGTVPENVLLNASHTHGGPDPIDDKFWYNKDRDTNASARYRCWLDRQICKATETAMSKLADGTLWFGSGKTAVPMNRRLERDGRIVNAPNPEGPVDDRLQLFAIKDSAGHLQALGIRVSCHPVATGAQTQITADFPGAFRAACFEKMGPDVTPFFLQGAGGDMRPRAVADGDKWREMPYDELPQIGQQLLQETLAVLDSDSMEELKDLELAGYFEYAKADCEPLYTSQQDFRKLADSDVAIEKIYANHCLRMLEAGGCIPDHVDIGVQTIWLTRDVAIVGIQGEVLIGLGACVENRFPAPKRICLLGYSNGCLAYFPDTIETKRGGYEKTGYLYSGWTGPFTEGLEKTIAAAVHPLADKE